MKRSMMCLTAVVLTVGCHQGTSPPPLTAPSVVVVPPPPVPRFGDGPAIIAPRLIPVGEVVEGRVEPGDPQCFPNWNASGRCRAFELTAASSGTLVFTLTWVPQKGEWNPDLFLIDASGSWIWTGDNPSPRTGEMSLENGLTYHVVVTSYLPTAQDFSLATKWR